MKLNNILFSYTITIFFLIALDLIFSSLFLGLGISNYRFFFEILIIIFLGLRFNSALLPFSIFAMMYVHSAFSAEGWEMGTIAGIVVCAVLGFLKDLLHVSGKISTMIMVQICQLLWFFVVSVIFCFKIGDFGLFFSKFIQYLPESLVMSFISPFLFDFLNKIWRYKPESSATGASL
ncbi:MAG: hypothetical protein ACOCUH_00405 [Bacteriovoracia bacterium]